MTINEYANTSEAGNVEAAVIDTIQNPITNTLDQET